MPTSDVIAEVSLALSYPEPFRVTGPPPSLVLRAEDMWRESVLFIGTPFSNL